MKRTLWMGAGVFASAIALVAGCSDPGGDGGAGDGDGDAGDGDAGDGDAGDGDAGDGDAGDGDAGDGDNVAGDSLYGDFVVLLTAENESTGNEAFTSFQGNVRTAELIDWMGWEFVREEGECELLVPNFPSCVPSCATGMDCAVGDICVPEAQSVNIGEITVTGLMTKAGSSEFSVSPLGSGANYLPGASASMEYPPAEDGAPVTLTGEIDGSPLSITTSGISPISVETDAIPIGGPDDVAVTWGAAESGSQSEMELIVDISHHGGVSGKVVCTTADDGEHTIPASLLNDLIDLGVAGFPMLTFHRVARGVSAAPHEIEFRIEQNVQVPIAIDGLVSCTVDEDCPENEACQSDRSCG